MLSQMEIQGFILISSAQIEFNSGFQVITGETGAGKSLFVKALNFLLGDKGSSDLVAKGFAQASVSCVFCIPRKHECLRILRDLGIENIPEGSLLKIRRTMNLKGRSHCWINEVSVTRGNLRMVGKTLVDISSQHENLSILDESNHASHLDAFLSSKHILPAYRQNFIATQKKFIETKKSILSYLEKASKEEILLNGSKLIESLDPNKEEYNCLLEDAKKIHFLYDRKKTLHEASRKLVPEKNGQSTSQSLWEAARVLESLQSPCSQESQIIEELKRLAQGVDDLSFDLDRLIENAPFNELMLEEIQNRIAEYQAYMRKHSIQTIEELEQHRNFIREELEYLARFRQTIEQEVEQLLIQCRKLKSSGRVLANARNEAANILEKKIKGELRDLAMPWANVVVERASNHPKSLESDLRLLEKSFSKNVKNGWAEILEIFSHHTRDGCERIRFLLATNSNEDPKPLVKIASGGEVSRILLALKRIIVEENYPATLVFDEIDTGISGRVADRVGFKLRQISEKVQVICISHLAQVTSYAQHHLKVKKNSSSSLEKSWVAIVTLNKESQVQEVARLLSGNKITSLSLANAKNLLESCNNQDSIGI